MVGSLPCTAFRVAVDEAAQFPLELFWAAPGQLRHARPGNCAGLIERHGERLSSGLDMLNGLVALQRPAVKYSRPGSGFGLGVVVFQRKQERLIGIAGESPDILLRG